MSDKSTPRPWRMDERNRPVGANGERILVDRFMLCGDEEATANDALIIRAVNQSDHVAELVEAANIGLSALKCTKKFPESIKVLVAALSHFAEVSR